MMSQCIGQLRNRNISSHDTQESTAPLQHSPQFEMRSHTHYTYFPQISAYYMKQSGCMKRPFIDECRRRF